MPNYAFANVSSTLMTITVDDEPITYKKCYCTTAVSGDNLLFFAHQVETNSYRQQYSIPYTNSIDPTAASAAELKDKVDAIINFYGEVRLAYLSYYDTTTQKNDADVNFMQFNTKSIENGITIVNDNEITVDKDGIYNIQFSAQVEKTDSGKDAIEIWLLYNGNNVTDSSTIITLDGNEAKDVAAWNFMIEMTAGSYAQLAWYSADANVQLTYRGTATTPDRPAVPSVILTVQQVTNGNS